MKVKRHLYILWSVLLFGLLSCAANTYESPFTRRKKAFKLATRQSKPIKLSTTGDRRSSQRSPASTSPLSELSTRRPHRPPAPVTPAEQHRAKIQSDFAALPDVSVTCSTSDFVLRVKPAFYGLGANAEELKLGSTCKSNGVLRPYGDLLFTYPLTACDAVRQSPRGYLVYKFVLHYEPSPKRFPSRAHRIDVDIECRYQRNHHVHQLTVKPTWQTALMRKRLKGGPNDFQIEFMDDSWSRPAEFQVFQLGKTVNFQVSAAHLPAGGKLYISSCYATPSSSSKSSLRYTIIDNFGCMLDSRRDPGASQFISRTDKTLRFSLKAFQFTSDPDTEVNIHCKLSVTSEGPGPAHKSCTYRGDRWTALTGDDSICECCDSQCVTSKPRRAMMEVKYISGILSPDWTRVGAGYQKMSFCVQQSGGSMLLTKHSISGSVLVSDQPFAAEDGFLPISPSSVFSMSREDDATINDELHGHEHVWGSADVVMYDEDEEEEQIEKERGVTVRTMTEPDLEELEFRKWVLMEESNESEVKDSHLFKEIGSGYTAQEDFSESEGEEEEISDAQQVIQLNQGEGEALEQMLSAEVTLQIVQPLDSEGEEEIRKHAGSEGDERTTTSEVEWKNDDFIDNRERTWYFTWR